MTPVLQVNDLSKHYVVSRAALGRRKVLRAVDGVSFSVGRGETLALVGESGCGKSTTARLAMRLLEATGGRVEFEGVDVGTLSAAALRQLRRRMQIIFQDPFASLNPRMTIGQTLEEPLIVHGMRSSVERKSRVAGVLSQVGLSAYHADRYPHEFSGGQRQRVGIARALMLSPSLIVCDEPVSALDVSIQAQVINLLQDLQRDLGLSYLFISHDLAVVKHIATRVAVMYLGKIVEIGPKEQFFSGPRHPYSRALLGAIPQPDPGLRRELPPIQGEIPSAMDVPGGCRFHTRCAFAIDRCRTEEPELLCVAPDWFAACHRTHDLPAQDPVSQVATHMSPTAQRRLALYASRRDNAAPELPTP